MTQHSHQAAEALAPVEESNGVAPAALQISNAIVALQKERVGRGPTKARTRILGDTIVCVLEGGLTHAERMLLEHGHGDAVFERRHLLQQAMRSDATAIVESVLGRRVRCHMSTADPEQDVQALTFILEP